MRDISSGLCVVECFPWPRQDLRIIAADLQGVGLIQPLSSSAVVKQFAEAFTAPLLQSFEHAVCAQCFRMERITEEVFQVPAEFSHEVLRRTLYRKLIGGRKADGLSGFRIGLSCQTE